MHVAAHVYRYDIGWSQSEEKWRYVDKREKKMLLLGLSFSIFRSSSYLVNGKSLRSGNVQTKLEGKVKSVCLIKYVAKKVHVKCRNISRQF